MNLIKKCRVCGGIASGFNYDGLSCDSCKVFFCRNGSKLESLRCDFSGNCQIGTSTRRKCPKCRLIKCFAIGMKKRSEIKSTNLASQVEDKIPIGADLILEISIIKSISNREIKQIADYVTNQNNFPQILVQKKRFPIGLNRYEQECLAEANSAIRVFRNENTAKVIRRANCIREMWGSAMLNNLLYIKKTINFCQNFGAFNSLSSGDQLAMLKPFCFSMMQVWFAFKHEAATTGLLMFTDESENEAIFFATELATSYKNQDVIHKLGDYAISLSNAMEGDVNIRDLLATLLLFKTQYNLSCPENIRYHYYLYCTILRRYLECKNRNRKEGNRKYLALMNLLKCMDAQFSENRKIWTLEVGVHNMPSLLRELYDLKEKVI